MDTVVVSILEYPRYSAQCRNDGNITTVKWNHMLSPTEDQVLPGQLKDLHNRINSDKKQNKESHIATDKKQINDNPHRYDVSTYIISHGYNSELRVDESSPNKLMNGCDIDDHAHDDGLPHAKRCKIYMTPPVEEINKDKSITNPSVTFIGKLTDSLAKAEQHLANLQPFSHPESREALKGLISFLQNYIGY